MKFLNKLKNDRQDLISNLLDNIESLEKLAFEQQAEIERLQYIKKHINDVILEDCVSETPEAYDICFQNLIKRLTNTKVAKSEAIKEYDKKLWRECVRTMDIDSLWRLKDIRKQVLKEMVGDDNA